MDVSGDYHPRSRKRSKGVQKSGRSHAIVIREDGDMADVMEFVIVGLSVLLIVRSVFDIFNLSLFIPQRRR